MCAGALEDYRYQIPLVLELEVTMSHLLWVLGANVGSCAKAICALNHRAISPVPRDFLLLGFVEHNLAALESWLNILIKETCTSGKWRGEVSSVWPHREEQQTKSEPTSPEPTVKVLTWCLR